MPPTLLETIKSRNGDKAIEDARSAAWEAVTEMSALTGSPSHEVESRAQLTVIRRVLGSMMPGGEAEFWQLVEKELRR